MAQAKMRQTFWQEKQNDTHTLHIDRIAIRHNLIEDIASKGSSGWYTMHLNLYAKLKPSAA